MTTSAGCISWSWGFNEWSDCICTGWTMEMAMDVSAFEHTQRNSQQQREQSVRSTVRSIMFATNRTKYLYIDIWPCSTWHFWWVFNDSYIISIYTSDPVLLDTSAEFSMKRVHVHLISHGNGNGCCCIWTHTQSNSQKREQSARSTVRSIMFATNRTKYPYIHLTLFFWPCSTWHFCWGFNEASACAPDEPWKWQ